MQYKCGGIVETSAKKPSQKPSFAVVSQSLALINYELTSSVESYALGYPRQAAFADSDESFMLYRRFGYLHARLLLQKQDELRALEVDLDDLDKRDARDETRRIGLRSRDLDEDLKAWPGREHRFSLLQRIEEKTLKYGKEQSLDSTKRHQKCHV